MLRQITPSLCTQSERHGYIMTIIITTTTTTTTRTTETITILIIIIIIDHDRHVIIFIQS